MVSVVIVATGLVLSGKVTLVLPAGTVTLAVSLPAVNVTIIPPPGAATLNATTPWEAVPPVTLAGLREKLVNTGAAGSGLITRVAVLVTPLKVAEKVSVEDVE